MGKTAHVFSTLANDQTYTNYDTNPEGIPIVNFECEIKGGAGVANNRLVTPLGIATEIPEEYIAQLEKNPDFQRHKKAGYILVRDRRNDPDKVATDMNARDPSKPLTPADYLNKEVERVISGGREVMSNAA